MSDFYDQYKYKVVLLGDGKVGKTSLVRKFVKNVFDDKYMATLGTNIYLKELNIKQGDHKIKVTLSLWDVLGQKSYQHVIKGALKGTAGVIFVTDLTNRDSLLNLQEWIHTVYSHLDNATFLFLGNKSDVADKEFGLIELTETANVYNSPALLTSAKSGENVETGFELIANRIMNEVKCPAKDEVEFPEFTEVIDPRIKASDQMIDLFCEELGGYERVMPVTRIVFKNLKIDFKNPSSEDLERLKEQFVDIVRDEKGDTIATYLKDRLDEATSAVDSP